MCIRDRVVRGIDTAQQAENTHQDRPDTDTDADAERIDHPGGGDGERDIDDHEDHRQ